MADEKEKVKHKGIHTGQDNYLMKPGPGQGVPEPNTGPRNIVPSGATFLG